MSLSYRLTDAFEVSAGLRFDHYEWDISHQKASDGKSTLYGLALVLGPVYYSRPFDMGPLKSARYFGSLSPGYSYMDCRLDFPVVEYDSAFGGELSVGLQSKGWSLELGYRHFKHDLKATKSGFAPGADVKDLDLSGFYIQAAYNP